MEKKITLIAIVLILALVFGIGAYAFTQTNKTETDKSVSNDINNQTGNTSNTNDSDLIVDSNDDNEVDPFIEDIPEDTANENKGSYILYSPSALTDNKNVIFFAASWCPTCRALDSSINSNLNSIPTDLTILKADYDSEKDLKQKYKVTIQHTLVQVDQNGNMIKKWNGSDNIEAIISELQ